ncbi:hypothetical protein FRC01_007118, partial [Tulasnella sp. 417]
PLAMSIPGDGFNRLPGELVCKIFQLVMEAGNSEIDRPRLGLVCHQWRNFIENSASLWTRILTLRGRTQFHRALENSRGAMIDLTYWGGMSLKEFLDEAGPHIARWRSLTATVNRDKEWEWAPLTKLQPPRLENLFLTMNQSGPWVALPENAITLFGGAPAPSTLKGLALDWFPLAVEPLRPSGLVLLSLRQVATISTLQLLEILRRSPGLEMLRLESNPKLEAIGPQASNIQPIELPKLVSLGFQHMKDDGTYCILSNIRIPNPRRSLRIAEPIRGVSPGPSFLTPAIAHLLHTAPIPPTDLPFSVINVEIFLADTCIIKFRGMELHVHVDGEDQVQDIFSWLVNGLGSEAAECPVDLILIDSDMDPIRIIAAMGPLIIKHLAVADAFVHGWVRPMREDLYRAMARSPDPTSPGWLLPRLESLSVTFLAVESQEPLISMLRDRYQGASLQGETESTRPMSLRSVELRGTPRTEGLAEEIKGILGEANVGWVNEYNGRPEWIG